MKSEMGVSAWDLRKMKLSRFQLPNLGLMLIPTNWSATHFAMTFFNERNINPIFEKINLASGITIKSTK